MKCQVVVYNFGQCVCIFRCCIRNFDLGINASGLFEKRFKDKR